VLNSVIHAIESVPPLPAYAIIAALVFGEAAVFIGFVLPGETAVLLGGFLASTHHLSIVTLCILVFVSAVVGDTVGFEVGKTFGRRILAWRMFGSHQAQLDSALDFLQRRGGPAVFLGRFTAFFRAVMPGLAGVSRMRYRTFLLWNATGGLVWGVGFALIGYVAGSSYERVAGQIGRGSLVVIVVVVLGGLATLHIRRRRRMRQAEVEYDGAHPDAQAARDALP
jgi:membrane protein DedA with SNARE-associated domain